MKFEAASLETEVDVFREEWAILLRAKAKELEPLRDEWFGGSHCLIRPTVEKYHALSLR